MPPIYYYSCMIKFAVCTQRNKILGNFSEYSYIVQREQSLYGHLCSNDNIFLPIYSIISRPPGSLRRICVCSRMITRNCIKNLKKTWSILGKQTVTYILLYSMWDITLVQFLTERLELGLEFWSQHVFFREFLHTHVTFLKYVLHFKNVET